jgi:hypothetical protein
MLITVQFPEGLPKKQNASSNKITLIGANGIGILGSVINFSFVVTRK